MGFSTLYGNDNFQGDTHWRAHLVTNFLSFQNPIPASSGPIPFEGFGEFSSRGNGNRPLAYLNPSSSAFPSKLTWGERLWGVTLPTQAPGVSQPATLATYIYAEANWGSVPKGVFITLYHFNIQNSIPGVPLNPNHHNTRVTQSALYPGALIAYVDAEDMSFFCSFGVSSLTTAGVDVNYGIVLTQLFSCASHQHQFDPEPLPTTANIPVTKILWANEATGINGSIWVDVHSQKVTSPAAVLSETDTEQTSFEAGAYGWETSHIADELRAQCKAVPGCMERSAVVASYGQAVLELPIEQQPSRSDLMLNALEVADSPSE
jgi:hypothetical protein